MSTDNKIDYMRAISAAEKRECLAAANQLYRSDVTGNRSWGECLQIAVNRHREGK